MRSGESGPCMEACGATGHRRILANFESAQLFVILFLEDAVRCGVFGIYENVVG